MTFEEIDEFLEEHQADYKLSFCIEYSSIIDWVAEFVPRKNHPLCREYNGPWRVQAMTAELACRLARDRFLQMTQKGDGNGQ